MKAETDMTAQKIHERIGRLRVGDFFIVETKEERAHALNSARYIGKRIVTKKTKEGGFTVAAIP